MNAVERNVIKSAIKNGAVKAGVDDLYSQLKKIVTSIRTSDFQDTKHLEKMMMLVQGLRAIVSNIPGEQHEKDALLDGTKDLVKDIREAHREAVFQPASIPRAKRYLVGQCDYLARLIYGIRKNVG